MHTKNQPNGKFELVCSSFEHNHRTNLPTFSIKTNKCKKSYCKNCMREKSNRNKNYTMLLTLHVIKTFSNKKCIAFIFHKVLATPHDNNVNIFYVIGFALKCYEYPLLRCILNLIQKSIFVWIFNLIILDFWIQSNCILNEVKFAPCELVGNMICTWVQYVWLNMFIRYLLRAAAQVLICFIKHLLIQTNKPQFAHNICAVHTQFGGSE